MIIENVWQFLVAMLSGGALLKMGEFGYREVKEWRSLRLASAKTITTNLSPLLKAADELVGKLTSLGRQDFLPIRHSDRRDMTNDEVLSLVYLLVQFWAWMELFRVAYYDDEVARSERGKMLTKFYDCLESRDIRIVDRIYQRALGEAAATVDRSPSLLDFLRVYREDRHFRRWLRPLITFVGSLDDPKSRQKLLRYTTILHVMIDCLDEEHTITRDRPALPNKLSRQSIRDLEYRWFGRYLAFVKQAQIDKYLGPPQGRP